MGSCSFSGLSLAVIPFAPPYSYSKYSTFDTSCVNNFAYLIVFVFLSTTVWHEQAERKIHSEECASANNSFDTAVVNLASVMEGYIHGRGRRSSLTKSNLKCTHDR